MIDYNPRRRWLKKNNLTYDEYLLSAHWVNLRRRIKRERGSRCEHCLSCFDLNVHHKNYYRIGAEEDSDLLVLCRDCHLKEHEGERFRKRRGYKRKKSLCCKSDLKLNGTHDQARLVCTTCGKRNHRMRRKEKLAIKKERKSLRWLPKIGGCVDLNVTNTSPVRVIRAARKKNMAKPKDEQWWVKQFRSFDF
jgi:hypothetical protein